MDFEDFTTLSNIEGEIRGFSKLIELDNFEATLKIELGKNIDKAKGVYIFFAHNSDTSYDKMMGILGDYLENIDEHIEVIFETDTNEKIEQNQIFFKYLIFGV